MKYLPFLFLLIFGAVTACETHTPPKGNDEIVVEPSIDIPSDPEQERICLEERGGEWKILAGGLQMPHYRCKYTHEDAGKTCTKDTDCDGLCLYDSENGTASCQAQSPLFGCFDVLTEAGTPATICID